MAIGGTPVGNMVIKVDLDAAGVEKSMTGLQRQLKSSNTAMGAQMSAFGRGEKSAGKYGTVIEGLSNRHKIQGAMVSEARKKYDEINKTHGEGSVKSQQAAQDLNKQIAMYEQTGRELSSMQTEFKEFQRVQDIQSKGWYKAADNMDKFGGKMVAVGGSMDRTGKKMTKGVTVPLAIVGGLAIKTGSDFEAGMSRVGAVSGASAKDMEKLEEKAREMGATTVFSAKEASDAFYYMSLAGWDANESMDGIAGIMDLAAASGEDLASVADIVTDGLSAFGLEAKDSGRMADVLAAASANANTDVAGLGAAFSYVAPVAGALGFTMEDTSKAIGLMANSGIKSTKAGTALRSMMTNLAKPTDEMKKAMEKYGISLTDSEGNMKSFDEIMRDLRSGIGDLSEEQQAQAASTLFGKESMSGALAIINASEEDYEKLTGAIEGSDGAAAEMAETMQDNLQGSLKELKSMVEDLFITLYQNLKPALEGVVQGAKDLTQFFAELSPKTQENIIKFGLLAAAIGPVLSITGKLTMGIGGIVQGAGILTKTIGLSKGVGLLGSLGALGPLAIGGIAVAGLGAVALAAYNLKDDTEKVVEVNLDLANSLSDQAITLQKSADQFDKLSGKAKLSNDELAQLNDLNIRINESSDPAVIESLQKEYDQLAKKSGLSKKEIKLLLEANADIIDQSPNVETSITEQGNAFVKSTEAVNAYIQELLEMSRQELSDELKIAQENKVKLLKEQENIQKDINTLNDTSLQLNYLEGLSDKDRQKTLNKMLTENKQGQADKRNSQETINKLKDEEEIINAYIQDGQAAGLEVIKKQRDALNDKLDLNDEELAKVKALESEMSDIVLQQVGITEEGKKGLVVLEDSILKDKSKLKVLEKQKGTKEGLSDEEKKQYKTLTEKVAKQVEAKIFLNEELGVSKNLNSLAEEGLALADESVRKKVVSLAKTSKIKTEEGNIVKQIETKNEKINESIKKLEKEREKNGANKGEIDKQIVALETKKGKNQENIKKILQELGVWKDLDSSIKDGINSEIKKGNEVDKTKGKVNKKGDAIKDNNKKTDTGTTKEGQRGKAADNTKGRYDAQGKSIDYNNKNTDSGKTKEDKRGGSALKTKVTYDLQGKSIVYNNKSTDSGKDKEGKRGVAAFRTKERYDLQGISIDKNNKKTDSGINKEEKRTKEAGKDVTKDVKVIPSYDPFDLSKDLSKKDSKTVDLGMNPIRKKFSIPFFKSYAKGTGIKGHPGGLAQVNDGVGSNAGQELIKTPDGKMGMFKGTNVFADLPKGTHVLSAKETKQAIPNYAKGTTTGLASNQEFGFKGIKNGLNKFVSGAINNVFTGIGKGATDFIGSNLTSNLKSVFGAGGDGKKGKPAFKWPITSHYGMRHNPVSGVYRLHAGTDYGAPSGTPIPSTSGGVVTHAGWAGGYGNQVKVKNGIWEMSYAHMSRVGVSRGQSVRKGTTLGYVGSTGNSTGPHLHYETRKNGVPLNPLTGYAKGTNNHPGGYAVVGEKGSELVSYPNGNSFISPSSHTLLDMPRGAKVTPHGDTKKMFKNAPSYSKGTSGFGDIFNFDNLKNNEFMKLLAVNDKRIGGSGKTRSQGSFNSDNNEELSLLRQQVDLLTQLVLKDTSVNIDGEEIKKSVNSRNAYDNLGRVF